MRLFVTGPTGSGKSTLARKLAERAAVPAFALDDIHWIRHADGDRRRDSAERLPMLERISRGDAWIIEGVQFKWADLAMERADWIVILDPPRWRNIVRIMRRFSHRRLSSDRRGTLKALKDKLRWSADYYGHERAMLFEKVDRWAGKVLVARRPRDERRLSDAVFAPTP